MKKWKTSSAQTRIRILNINIISTTIGSSNIVIITNASRWNIPCKLIYSLCYFELLKHSTYMYISGWFTHTLSYIVHQIFVDHDYTLALCYSWFKQNTVFINNFSLQSSPNFALNHVLLPPSTNISKPYIIIIITMVKYH